MEDHLRVDWVDFIASSADRSQCRDETGRGVDERLRKQQ